MANSFYYTDGAASDHTLYVGDGTDTQLFVLGGTEYGVDETGIEIASELTPDRMADQYRGGAFGLQWNAGKSAIQAKYPGEDASKFRHIANGYDPEDLAGIGDPPQLGADSRPLRRGGRGPLRCRTAPGAAPATPGVRTALGRRAPHCVH